ncbi:MAG: HAD hydrolase family protein [Chloroflexi bacterium]|nr:HAD hydrolase family protein [Chloroflexota bacterium]
MIYCFDIDGTLCNDSGGNYPEATPRPEVIAKLNKLYAAGHTIIIHTARGATSGIDWLKLTEEQLKTWQVHYHRLVMGRPGADVYIDDKTIPVSEWLRGD